MFSIFDIGAAPANEDCAQIGHTPDFDACNRLEVESYRAAIQARFGPPPEGCALVAIGNAHDFGRYLTLGLKVWRFAQDRAEVAAYVETAENGLSTWIEAGFTAPIRYAPGGDVLERRAGLEEIVIGALMTTRPTSGGQFPIPDFAHLHANIAAAYPACAAQARARLAALCA